MLLGETDRDAKSRHSDAGAKYSAVLSISGIVRWLNQPLHAKGAIGSFDVDGPLAL
jgi:hypothetical protein